MKLLFILFSFILLNAQSNKSFPEALNTANSIIISKEIGLIKNHLERLDSIYFKTLRALNYDYSETFLALTFATLPYNKMPISLPIIGIKFNIPLPSPDSLIFEKRKKNLPSQLADDSPLNEFGDKDKVSHFFGNAFLSFNFNLFNLSKFIGILIELFEESFGVQGGVDPRDFRFNNLGNDFGIKVTENPALKPSDILKINFKGNR